MLDKCCNDCQSSPLLLISYNGEPALCAVCLAKRHPYESRQLAEFLSNFYGIPLKVAR